MKLTNEPVTLVTLVTDEGRVSRLSRLSRLSHDTRVNWMLASRREAKRWKLTAATLEQSQGDR